ncbi:MAG: hypothetical protein FK734_19620 [Asgard group archaeon]|nr:hypothetical protein [Asgard group archaeon]
MIAHLNNIIFWDTTIWSSILTIIYICSMVVLLFLTSLVIQLILQKRENKFVDKKKKNAFIIISYGISYTFFFLIYITVLSIKKIKAGLYLPSYAITYDASFIVISLFVIISLSIILIIIGSVLLIRRKKHLARIDEKMEVS